MMQGRTPYWLNSRYCSSLALLSVMLLNLTAHTVYASNSITETAPSAHRTLSDPNQAVLATGLSSEQFAFLRPKNPLQSASRGSLWQIAPALSEILSMEQGAQMIAAPEKSGTIVDQQQYPEWRITKATLSNGLVVLVKQQPVSTDSIYIQLRARGGMRSLPPELLAAAELLSLKVTPSPRINNPNQSNALQNFAMRFNVQLQPTITASQHGISGSASNDSIDVWLALARQMLIAPRFNEQSLHEIQTQEASVMNQYLQTPTGSFQANLQQYLFPNNPYVRFSLPRDLQNVSLKQLKAVHSQLSSTLEGAELVVVGDVEPQKVLASINRYLGALDLGSQPYWNNYPFLLKKSAPLIDTQSPDEQALVVITRLSVPAMTDDVEHRLAHKVLQNILQQRIEQQLNAVFGQASSVVVDMTYPATDMQMNMLQIRAKVPPDQYVDVEVMLKKQIDTLLFEGCGAEEIETARQQVARQLSTLWQDPQHSAQILSVYSLAGYPIEDIMQMPSLLAGISDQMIRDLTLYYLNAPGQLTAGFLPNKRHKKSIESGSVSP
ncbi:M16 family metallopeptidase [Plesiomonas sp.]|uniref:M16 family metallopeptidase n=1 Tax=Plesiomonas sp. TaxID=2486279 RepID=UPI003F3C8D43